MFPPEASEEVLVGLKAEGFKLMYNKTQVSHFEERDNLFIEIKSCDILNILVIILMYILVKLSKLQKQRYDRQRN